MTFSNTLNLIKQKPGKCPAFVGRDDWIRTSDHTHPMRVRYQTAPHPEIWIAKIVISVKMDIIPRDIFL